jgi:predicted transcriptional regulator
MVKAYRRSVFGLRYMTDNRRGASSNALPQLGELELAVLEALWRRGELTARQLPEALPDDLQPSLSTIQTTLERLHRKGLLRRQKRGHAYSYNPRLSRSALLGSLLGGVISRLHSGSLDPILSSFVEFAERIDSASLDRLDALVQQRKKMRSRKHD